MPAPVVFQTSCGQFTFEPDGGVLVGGPRPRQPAYSNAPVFKLPKARHVLTRRGVKGETPLGWSPAHDLYTVRAFRRQHSWWRTLILRDDSGKLLGTIATGVSAPFPVEAHGTLLYQKNGRLFRADGLRTRELLDLNRFGVRNWWMSPLTGGFIGIFGHGSALLRHDGGVVATVPFMAANFYPAKGGRIVAAVGPSRIYLLRPHTPMRAVYKGAAPLQGCDVRVGTAWKEQWLLISDRGNGKVFAVDAAMKNRRIDLTSLARRLPGFVLNVSWS